MKTFYAWDGDTLVLNVLGTASAANDRIGPPRGAQLKVSVTAAPEDGKATDHMLRLLATCFGVRRADIELAFGRTSVNKQFRIRAPAVLPAGIEKAPSAASRPDATASAPVRRSRRRG